MKFFKNEYPLFLTLAAIYTVYLFSLNIASVAGIFAPYLFLCFAAANRNGRTPYIVMSAVLAAGALTVSLPSTAIFLGTAILPALILILSHSGGRQYSWKAVLLSPLPAAVLIAAILLLAPEIRAEIEALIIKFAEQTMAGLTGANTGDLKPDSAFALYYNQKEEIASYLVSLIPAFMYISVAFVTYVTEKTFYNIPPNDILPLPDFLLAVVILSGLCLIITPLKLHMAGWNGVIIAGALYFLRGFDIVRYYMNRWQIALFLRMIIYVLIFMQQFLNLAVAALGFISIYKNPVRTNGCEQSKK